jgi:hypothetical protein
MLLLLHKKLAAGGVWLTILTPPPQCFSAAMALAMVIGFVDPSAQQYLK